MKAGRKVWFALRELAEQNKLPTRSYGGNSFYVGSGEVRVIYDQSDSHLPEHHEFLYIHRDGVQKAEGFILPSGVDAWYRLNSDGKEFRLGGEFTLIGFLFARLLEVLEDRSDDGSLTDEEMKNLAHA